MPVNTDIADKSSPESGCKDKPNILSSPNLLPESFSKSFSHLFLSSIYIAKPELVTRLSFKAVQR